MRILNRPQPSHLKIVVVVVGGSPLYTYIPYSIRLYMHLICSFGLSCVLRRSPPERRRSTPYLVQRDMHLVVVLISSLLYI